MGVYGILSAIFIVICSCQATVFDIDELAVQYGIEISNKPIVLNSQSQSQSTNVMQLSSKHGQRYSCFLPPPPAQIEETEANNANLNTTSIVDILDKSFNDS